MTIPSKIILYQDNDQFIEINGLANGVDPTDFFTSATVTATLLDPNGNPVEGLTDVVLTYLPDDNSPTWVDGSYRGPVQETFNPPVGSGYILHITSDEDGVIGNWFIKTRIKIRRT